MTKFPIELTVQDMSDRPQQLTLTDLIIEAMPFSDELIHWCQKHPEFMRELKFANEGRFLPLGFIKLHPQDKSTDKVIGFVVYDMQQNKFKQDFIVDVESKSKEFVLFTVPQEPESRYVKHIDNFKTKHSLKAGDLSDHHLELEQLDAVGIEELSRRAKWAIEVASSAKQPNKLSQKRLKEVLVHIQEQKVSLGDNATEWFA